MRLIALPAALEEIGGRFQPRERLPLIVADVKTPLRVSEQTEHVACAAYIAMCEGSPPSSVGRRIARRVRMFAASKCIWRSSGSAFQPSTLPSRRRPSSGIAPATAATSTRLNACSCLGDVTRAPGTTILSESKPRRGSGRAFDRRRCCQPPTRQRVYRGEANQAAKWSEYRACMSAQSKPSRSIVDIAPKWITKPYRRRPTCDRRKRRRGRWRGTECRPRALSVADDSVGTKKSNIRFRYSSGA